MLLKHDTVDAREVRAYTETNRVGKVVLYTLEPNIPQTFNGVLQYRTIAFLWVTDSFAAVESRGRLLHRLRPSVGIQDCSNLLPLSTVLISEYSYIHISIYICRHHRDLAFNFSTSFDISRGSYGLNNHPPLSHHSSYALSHLSPLSFQISPSAFIQYFNNFFVFNLCCHIMNAAFRLSRGPCVHECAHDCVCLSAFVLSAGHGPKLEGSSGSNSAGSSIGMLEMSYTRDSKANTNQRIL